jgi:hypothetical protein
MSGLVVQHVTECHLCLLFWLRVSFILHSHSAAWLRGLQSTWHNRETKLLVNYVYGKETQVAKGIFGRKGDRFCVRVCLCCQGNYIK